jgi:hypothetical protein
MSDNGSVFQSGMRLRLAFDPEQIAIKFPVFSPSASVMFLRCSAR